MSTRTWPLWWHPTTNAVIGIWLVMVALDAEGGARTAAIVCAAANLACCLILIAAMLHDARTSDSGTERP